MSDHFDRLELGVGRLQRIDVARSEPAARCPAAPAKTTAADASEDDCEADATSLLVRPGYCPASVATSFQLGSRDETSRAKVQTSVTSVTLSGLPSITLPVRSRVTETSCETNRTVTCAVGPRTSAPVMSDLSIETKRVSDGLALGLAFADRAVEAVVDLARQQVLERAPVAFGIGGDDHLVGLRARRR